MAALPKKLRTIAEFLKQHQRTPTPQELAAIGGAGSMPQITAADPKFADYLTYFQSLATFVETHGRLPREDEQPKDPF